MLILIASYPRSGQVWLGRLIARALGGRMGTRLEQDRGRDIAAERFGDAAVEVHRTHSLPEQVLNHNAAFLEGHRVPDRVIHIVRDPRDVLCSNWRYRFGGPDGNMDKAFERMIRGGNWARYVALWEDLPSHAPCHATIRYEDLRADPVRALTELLVTLDLPVVTVPGGVEAAIEAEAFAKREATIATGHGVPGWTDGSAKVSNGQAARHLGRATVGGWQGEIPPRFLRGLETACAEWMERFGWEPSIA